MSHPAWTYEVAAAMKDLLAENERLRAALKDIAALKLTWPAMVERAREALSRKS